MHPRATKLQRGARDALQLGFEPAGVTLPASRRRAATRGRAQAVRLAA
jgi:hypothetical protein